MRERVLETFILDNNDYTVYIVALVVMMLLWTMNNIK